MRQYKGVDPTRITDPIARAAIYDLDQWARSVSTNVGGESTLPVTQENKILGASDEGVPIAGVEAVPGKSHLLRINSSGHALVNVTNSPTVTLAEPISVDDNGSSLTVDTAAGAIDVQATDLDIRDLAFATDKVDVSGSSVSVSGSVTVAEPVSVDDNAGSLTVDTALGAIDVQATNLDIRDLVFASDKVDVSGSSVSVSGTVTVDTELGTADFDTGGGTDTQAVIGLIVPGSGGGQLIPGDSTAGLKVNLGADNDVTVTSGNITADTELSTAQAHANGTTPSNGPVVIGYNYARDEGATTVSPVSGEFSSVDTEAGNDGDFAQHVSDVVKNYYATPDTIATTYNNTTTTATSSAIDVRRMREGMFGFTLVSASTPTDITFEILFSETSGGTYYTYCKDEWCNLIFDDTICSSAINRCYGFKVVGNYMKIKVTATGTTVSATFTVSNPRLALKN